MKFSYQFNVGCTGFIHGLTKKKAIEIESILNKRFREEYDGNAEDSISVHSYPCDTFGSVPDNWSVMITWSCYSFDWKMPGCYNLIRSSQQRINDLIQELLDYEKKDES